jgi:hypothetical protein
VPAKTTFSIAARLAMTDEEYVRYEHCRLPIAGFFFASGII